MIVNYDMDSKLYIVLYIFKLILYFTVLFPCVLSDVTFSVNSEGLEFDFP